MKSETANGLIPLPRVAGNWYGREDAITSLKCVSPDSDGCGRQIQPGEILGWDQRTIKEYRQSGWCPACQNRIFSDSCICEYVDVGIGLMPNPNNEYCPEHGEPEDIEHAWGPEYDPDMREDEPPHDITEIAWPVGVL